MESKEPALSQNEREMGESVSKIYNLYVYIFIYLSENLRAALKASY